MRERGAARSYSDSAKWKESALACAGRRNQWLLRQRAAPLRSGLLAIAGATNCWPVGRPADCWRRAKQVTATLTGARNSFVAEAIESAQWSKTVARELLLEEPLLALRDIQRQTGRERSCSHTANRRRRRTEDAT